MARARVQEDWDDDDDAWRDDDAEATIRCPYCRADIHEDSVQCPRCGKYISEEDSPPRKPWWVIIGTLGCLFVIYRWIVSP